jgi:hypothetical protein
LAKPKKEEKPDSDEVIAKRMENALKHALHTPHDTNKELVERRRRSLIHKSDCAIHDAPAYEAGACTCGAEPDSKARR